jgi:capsular polysaccharide biosynthesis protein
MNTPTFDLVEIVKITQRNLKLILLVTFSAALIGAIGYKLQDKKYKAEAEAYLLNPLFGDRNNIFRRATEDLRFVDYFGTEGDVDRVMTMIASKDVQDSVISAMDLYKAYQLDPQKQADRVAMNYRYDKSFDAKRTENSSVMATFTDTDPIRAAAILDAIIKITDAKMRMYIAKVKHNSMEVVNKKILSVDTLIAKCTDSLVLLRDKYKIYDIISPNRKSLITGSINTNGKINPSRGVEEVQNLEAIKDQYVINRAELSATANELNSKVGDEVQLLHNVTTPQPPMKASGLGTILTTVACAFVAFFFSVLLLSFIAYIKALANTQR